MSNYLPTGFRDYFFDDAEALHAAAERLAAVFARWGFRRFTPAAVEDGDTFAQGAGEGLLRDSFRFADRTGELLVLRSDMTLQAARVIGGELNELPPPIRVFYADRVFRNMPEGRGALREVWQAGVELAGASGPEADAEIVAVALEGLVAAGFDAASLKIDLGHAGFVRNLVRATKLTEAQGALVARALERKDGRALRALRDEGDLSAAAFDAAARLVDAFGLDGADAIDALGLEFLAEPAAELRAIAGVLATYGANASLSVDPGEVRGFEYYTGFFFHIYSSDEGRPLAAGGRYDGLVSAYGRDLPAVGCAIDLEVVAARSKPARLRRVHILNFREHRDDALLLAKRLRECGFAVSRDIVRRPADQSQLFAERAGMDHLVLLNTTETLELVTLADGSKATFSAVDALVENLLRLEP